MTTRWVACPSCGNPKLLKCRSDTRAKNLIVYCKRCKNENMININLRVPSAKQ
ncbi:MAG: hypothetical protein HFI34_06775 [Lachnospiraceae bacterium]|nr:hypothetical protein [Lachnospiraceae bacterium]